MSNVADMRCIRDGMRDVLKSVSANRNCHDIDPVVPFGPGKCTVWQIVSRINYRVIGKISTNADTAKKYISHSAQ